MGLTAVERPRRFNDRSRSARAAKRREQGLFALPTHVGQAVLLGVVAVTPWLFGGVQARVQVWVFVGVLAALACAAASLLSRRGGKARLPSAIIPLLAAIGLGLFQIIPLQANAVALLSPEAARLRGALEGGGGLACQPRAAAAASNAAASPLSAGRFPLSLYPASTRRDTTLLGLAAAVFLLGSVLFRTRPGILVLCIVVAVNGAALAFFGLVQNLTWDGLLYWSVPLTQGGSPFASFVNRNHAACCLNLGLAGALGLAVWTAGRRHAGDATPETGFGAPGMRAAARARTALSDFLSRLDAPAVASIALAACTVGGVLCSLSRGGFLGGLGGAIAALCLILLARRHRSLRLWCSCAAAAGVGLVVWVGMQDAVTHRLATLLDRDAMSCTRIPHWRDGARAVPDFWRLGSGLGTYRYVYCLYQQRPDQAWYYHAENQYLETLVESGVVGFGLLLAAIGLVGAAAWRLVLTKGDIASLALGVAGLFALASQAIHGFFDFGLYMPANLMLLALLCGAVCGRAAHVGSRRSAMPLAAVPVNRFATACLAGVFVPLLLCGLAEARKVQTVETALKDTREHALVTLTPPSVEPDAAWGQGTQSRNAPRETRGLYAAPGAQKPHSSSAAILLEDIRRLEQAVKSRPDDAEAHARLARLWINLYRVRALEQLRAEKIAGVDDAKLWDYTSPRRLHGAVHHLARAAAKDQLVQLRQHPLVSGNLRPAIRHLTLARSACSLLPNVHLELAQLSGLVGEPGLDQIHLDRAIRLSPGDPAMLLMCGLLELQAGRNGLAAKTWRDSIRLDRSRLDRILAAAEKQFDARSLIEDVLPDSPELLLELARTRYTQEKGAELHKMLIDRADELIARAELPEPQRCRLQGLVFAMRKEHGRAIDRYYRAVELRRQDPGWRYELALALTGASRLQEAHQQAILCARMAPGNGQYQALLRELNHRLLAEASP